MDGHLSPPIPTKRPKAPGRNSTIIHKPNKESKGKGKGKGKNTKWDSDDDDDDEAYVTSNDFATPEQMTNGSNGAFGAVGGDDDSELYD